MANQGAWYVVFRGCHPGIYPNWESLDAQVIGHPSALYRKCLTYEVALNAWIEYFQSPSQTLAVPVCHIIPASAVPVMTTDMNFAPTQAAEHLAPTHARALSSIQTFMPLTVESVSRVNTCGTSSLRGDVGGNGASSSSSDETRTG
ncbi:hypothetical protein PIB30_056402 [Stylosanthes scabra]|uniref:Ribonuclease H1 N-terminal domain-containing protein n=1 Tax=Stylosanthes scabra TaxID=79078 RepID=A0ABU6XKZ0_9FABA|nr:hypothetical protein [Stylosanthes scabra]